MTSPTIYVTVLPYLPLRERVEVGDWELIPREEFRDEDALDAQAAEDARGVLDLHDLPGSPTPPVRGFGAFARPLAGRVGDAPPDEDGSSLTALYRALVIALIDRNDSPVQPEEERDPNAGHRAVTSDNAIVSIFGVHDGWTGTVGGSRVRLLSMGLRVRPDDQMPRVAIPPPGDLRLPMMVRSLDDDYARAAWESLGRGTDAARRLGRASDWLGLAWCNAGGLTDAIRVPALFAGFEILLDSDETPTLRTRLSDLLDADDADRTERAWTSRRGNEMRDEMTELEWWFVKFADLRNALMHGHAMTPEDWAFGDVSQIDHGGWWLRQAIKETIARDGHEDVREEVIWRLAMRDALRFMRERRKAETDHAGEG